jgi:selenium metabolism protein YedF
MKTTILLNSKNLGIGDDKLGEKLIGSFLNKIWMLDEKPDTIIFYNSAVKLLSNDSFVLDSLISISDSGVDLVACGTCVGFFGLEGKIKIGRVSDMVEIVRILTKSEKVITP